MPARLAQKACLGPHRPKYLPVFSLSYAILKEWRAKYKRKDMPLTLGQLDSKTLDYHLNLLLSHLLPALRDLSFPREGRSFRFRDYDHVQTMPHEYFGEYGCSPDPNLQMIPSLSTPFIDLLAELGIF